MAQWSIVSGHTVDLKVLGLILLNADLLGTEIRYLAFLGKGKKQELSCAICTH